MVTLTSQSSSDWEMRSWSALREVRGCLNLPAGHGSVRVGEWREDGGPDPLPTQPERVVVYLLYLHKFPLNKGCRSSRKFANAPGGWCSPGVGHREGSGSPFASCPLSAVLGAQRGGRGAKQKQVTKGLGPALGQTAAAHSAVLARAGVCVCVNRPVRAHTGMQCLFASMCCVRVSLCIRVLWSLYLCGYACVYVCVGVCLVFVCESAWVCVCVCPRTGHDNPVPALLLCGPPGGSFTLEPFSPLWSEQPVALAVDKPFYQDIPRVMNDTIPHHWAQGPRAPPGG